MRFNELYKILLEGWENLEGCQVDSTLKAILDKYGAVWPDMTNVSEFGFWSSHEYEGVYATTNGRPYRVGVLDMLPNLKPEYKARLDRDIEGVLSGIRAKWVEGMTGEDYIGKMDDAEYNATLKQGLFEPEPKAEVDDQETYDARQAEVRTRRDEEDEAEGLDDSEKSKARLADINRRLAAADDAVIKPWLDNPINKGTSSQYK